MNQLEKINSNSNLKKIEILNLIDDLSIWLINFNSNDTRRTYMTSIREFTKFLDISDSKQLKDVKNVHIIAFREFLKKEGNKPRAINTRLSAISSLYKWLRNNNVEWITINPMFWVEYMKVRKKWHQNKVEAKVLTPHEARLILDSPQWESELAYRDRAILWVLLFTWCRREEITNLKVKDNFNENWFSKLDFTIKWWTRHRVPICQELQVRINQYFKIKWHYDNKDYPLFLPTKTSKNVDKIRSLTWTQIYRIWQKYTKLVWIEGTRPHSARATFITTALENNCKVESTQHTVWHSDVRTTLMYDKRAKNDRDSASFAVRYE